MKNLIITGAGDAGRETLEYAKLINSKKETWIIKGFIDDMPTPIKEKTNGEYHIIGTIKEWIPSNDEEFVVAISNSKARRKVIETLLAKGADIISFFADSVTFSDYTTIGKGVYLGRDVCIGPNAVIEDYTYIQCSIPHDAIVHSYATVYSAVIGGGTEIGEGAQIGSGVTIAPYIKIGKNATVAIGSVVVRNVPDNVTVMGNPAKRIKL